MKDITRFAVQWDSCCIIEEGCQFSVFCSLFSVLCFLFSLLALCHTEPVEVLLKSNFKKQLQKATSKSNFKNQLQKSTSKINFKKQLQKSTSTSKFKNQVQLQRQKAQPTTHNLQPTTKTTTTTT